MLRNWSRDEILHLVFQRINTGSVKLSPQELRQSLFPGSFLTFADSFTGESQAFRWLLNNKAPDFRMRDVEIFVRFIGYSTRLSEYSGNLKKFLDETSKEFNRSWSNSEELVVSLAEECEAAIMCVKEIFGEDAAF